MTDTNTIRRTFLDFFQKHDHKLIPSSPLIPANDPTLLFTNAGMVQFKDIFLGLTPCPHKRVVTAQRCIRAGGKHNDLENVGYTARHHTFFEMLGNFSFGDYFKEEAIHFAWTFLTEVLEIPAEKLWVTVFEADKEAEAIWLKTMKIAPERFSRCGHVENFWSMGDTGPCGPCSEIFFDHGPCVAGAPPGRDAALQDRYVEIWNLVFMQFDRKKDGTLSPLPKPSVDTGMGLERIAAVMQGVHNNYDTDIFQNVMSAVANLAKRPLSRTTSAKVIADHIRSVVFLIADGITPSNEGRGYVLRRIIRRAVRHGYQLGLLDPFLHQLVAVVVENMGQAYPDLLSKRAVIEKIILHEENQFRHTLSQGLKLFDKALQNLHNNQVPGALIFRLYDTFGFPYDLTADIAREKGLSVDLVGFQKAMDKQRQCSKAASQFVLHNKMTPQIKQQTEFTGYLKLQDSAKVVALMQEDRLVSSLDAPALATVVLDRTPFYAESGGQVGDTGKLLFEKGCFEVTDTKKQGTAILHHGSLQSGSLEVGTSVVAQVDEKRHQIACNHSATHLLHAALRSVLGRHVIQKGSLVSALRLRFDFSHFAPLKEVERMQIERLVNQKIWDNLPVKISHMPLQAAKDKGALTLFDEKYTDTVRVLQMGDFSMELCGGTHVTHTGAIGSFRILQETGIASGIRRIEACTGSVAFDAIQQQDKMLFAAARLLKTNPSGIYDKLIQNAGLKHDLEVKLQTWRKRFLNKQCEVLHTNSKMIADVPYCIEKLKQMDMKDLDYLGTRYMQKCTNALLVLVSITDARIYVVVKSGVPVLSAERALACLFSVLGGKGGGNAKKAQGSGPIASKDTLQRALDRVENWVAKEIKTN